MGGGCSRRRYQAPQVVPYAVRSETNAAIVTDTYDTALSLALQQDADLVRQIRPETIVQPPPLQRPNPAITDPTQRDDAIVVPTANAVPPVGYRLDMNNETTMIDFVCPAGSRAGDKVRIRHGDREFDLIVPVGISEGQGFVAVLPDEGAVAGLETLTYEEYGAYWSRQETRRVQGPRMVREAQGTQPSPELLAARRLSEAAARTLVSRWSVEQEELERALVESAEQEAQERALAESMEQEQPERALAEEAQETQHSPELLAARRLSEAEARRRAVDESVEEEDWRLSEAAARTLVSRWSVEQEELERALERALWNKRNRSERWPSLWNRRSWSERWLGRQICWQCATK